MRKWKQQNEKKKGNGILFGLIYHSIETYGQTLRKYF